MGHEGDLWQRLANARAVDLAQGMRRGMPVSPNHPAYQMALLRRHGDMTRGDGSSAANEIIVTGGHVGTHIDALSHVSRDGLLHGGVPAADVMSHEGFSTHGIDAFPPFLGRGVLLDVAKVHGVDVLEPAYEVTPDDLDAAERLAGVEVQEGDGVLIRTGWALLWEDTEAFGGAADGTPGPSAAAADWLLDRKVALTGGETIPYERIAPGAGHSSLPAHPKLLVDGGIHIVEVLDLTELAEANPGAFALVIAPLKLIGATGSPVRPLAILEA